MRRNLAGRRVLISGASSGIGRALAELLAREGTRVLGTARSSGLLEELAQKIHREGGEMVAVPADITLPEDRQRLIDTANERWGGLDLLINNAGVGSFGHFASSSEAVLRQVMEVNFFAAAELIRLAIPVLARGEQPAIVNVASMCGRRAMPAWPEYSASKFGLCGLTEALRGEMARFDIDVLLVLPGLTRSNLSRKMLRNEGRMKIAYDEGMPPEVVAGAILQVIRKNRTETAVGSDARWMLRFHKFFPRLLDWLIARRVKKLYAREV